MINLNKVAIMIDGGFFKQKFKSKTKMYPQIEDMNLLVKDIMSKIQVKTGSCSQDVLFRVFYYDCLPYSQTAKDPNGKSIDFKQSRSYQYHNKFINELKRLDQVALRMGEMSFDGWYWENPTGNPVPRFHQKGVDMKIGLDMAWMASKRIVDKIVLVTGDSDFISPMKLVRKEGILVYLYPMKHYIKMGLLEHCDFLLEES